MSIKAKVVFKNSDGVVIPTSALNSWSPGEFFRMWAKGEIYRDVEVKLDNPDDVAKKLHDYKSPEFQIVGAEVFSAWSELDVQLSLPDKFLELWCSDSEGDVPPPFEVADRVVHILPDGETIELPGGVAKHHANFYYTCSNLSHEQDWYCRDPHKVVYDLIIELLQGMTMKDNDTLLMLMSRMVREKEEQEEFESFTPVAFSKVRDCVWQWAIPVPHCIATAGVLAGLGDEDWERFHDPDFRNDPQPLPLNGRIMDIEVHCVGSPHDKFHLKLKDLPNFYMCGSPHALGVRGVRLNSTVKPLEVHLLDKEQMGWMVFNYIATAILNSRAVAVATFRN